MIEKSLTNIAFVAQHIGTLIAILQFSRLINIEMEGVCFWWVSGRKVNGGFGLVRSYLVGCMPITLVFYVTSNMELIYCVCFLLFKVVLGLGFAWRIVAFFRLYVDDLQRLAASLGCGVVSLMTSYLC